MKCFRQLLRQPIKFIAGLILMTVAAAIVCVCVGQALAAKNTAEQLDQRFTTVVLPMAVNRLNEDKLLVPDVSLPKVFRQWLEDTAETDTNIIKTVAETGIISAYIPELIPLNVTQSSYTPEWVSTDNPYSSLFFYKPDPYGVPYSCAMLVVTLDEIGDPYEHKNSFFLEKRSMDEFPTPEAYYRWNASAERTHATFGYSVSLSGTITDVVSLQEGYRDPTGMTAQLRIQVATLEELESLELEVGSQYVVYGMDYFDKDWALKGILADERQELPVQIDRFDLNKLTYLSEREQEALGNRYVARYDGTIYLTEEMINQINTISMTLYTPCPGILYDEIRDENGVLLELAIKTDRTYIDRNGETVTMSKEAYEDRYRIPTVTKLEGNVEDFLQSEEGAFWQQALLRDGINNHAFAVLGVDKLGCLADFAREDSRITRGRDFSAEELENCAKVCILNEAVAVASGLELGDTITLNLYNGDLGLPYQQFRTNKCGLLVPSADFFFETTPIVETGEYVIVGFYRSRDLWPDVSANEYGLSPNTVFVPKSSVATEWEYPNSILFTTIVLYNGKIEEFHNMATEAGFHSGLAYYDQGYSDLAGNFHNYETLAQQVLTVGISAYAVILLLFLILFPGTQGKAVATMESLGATRGKRFGYVMLSANGIVAPATVLGGGIGLLLWQRVLDALQASAESTLGLQLETGTLLLLALVQLVFAMVLTAILAVWVSKPRGLSKRRNK